MEEKRMTIRLPLWLYERLREMGRLHHRSLNGEIVEILETSMAMDEQDNGANNDKQGK